MEDIQKPKWFTLTKKIISWVTNTTIPILLVCGFQDDALPLLLIKIGQSSIMEFLDTILLDLINITIPKI